MLGVHPRPAALTSILAIAFIANDPPKLQLGVSPRLCHALLLTKTARRPSWLWPTPSTLSGRTPRPSRDALRVGSLLKALRTALRASLSLGQTLANTPGTFVVYGSRLTDTTVTSSVTGPASLAKRRMSDW